jgi:pyruvate dehydrogenase E1 component alpha subunit
MFAELYGRSTGCAGGKGGSQHLVDTECGFMGAAPILSSTISVGVGAAWAEQLSGRDSICVVYFGDGATEEGAFHESLNFASLMKLPVIFVCENNLYSVHSKMSVRQPDRPISAFGTAHGMPGVQVDGNNVIDVYTVVCEAISRIRKGNGPTLIEANTYRWKEHCGPGDDISLGYRLVSELSRWKNHDPVASFEAELLKQDIKKIRAQAITDVDLAVAFARASPYPDAAALYHDVLPGLNHA